MYKYIIHGKNIVVMMTDELNVPKLTNNLFSVHAATSKGKVMSFSYVSVLPDLKQEKEVNWHWFTYG